MRTEGRLPEIAFTRTVMRRYMSGRSGVSAKARSFWVPEVFCSSRQPAKSWSLVTSAALAAPA